MSKLSQFQSPGQALKYFLDDYIWTQEDLAQVLSISTKHVNEMVKDKKSITISTAKLLQSAFDLSAEDWMQLDTKYQLTKNNLDAKDDSVYRKKLIYIEMPITEMLKKGWLKKFDKVSNLEKQINDFWGQNKISESGFNFINALEKKLNYKKSEAFKEKFNPKNAVIWYQMVLNFSKKLDVEKFDRAALYNLMQTMHSYTTQPNGVKNFLNELKEVGVKFVYLSHLSKTYLDGAAFLDGKTPVVCLTGRFDRIDNFWHTLSHELSHVYLHLSKTDDSNLIFIDDTSSKKTSKKEKEANELTDVVLLKSSIFSALKFNMNYITEELVRNVSKEIDLHPSIVVGQLAFNGKVSYSTTHRFKESIKDKIPAKYKADRV
ncbi:XRE family transcriptional regulator [Maribacter sp. ACAM166]|uniref:XRE family transcriptional regulator n=1 Tax=Maribacter sp. ACAM166 TaxID=2508996 RepID=UPI0010FE240F|nr:ImmA/IrrE family metallo-endopeptidase [Maribacter sp. ACAM166]TLP75684.1 ImmA/IrrE family metallo-endopeptidase [Maribacter sp. ACAM166]